MFKGYLIKKNNSIFRHDLIAVDSYDIAPNQRQDVDSYVDGNGVLKRTVLPHRRSKIEFTTIPMNEIDMEYIRNYFTDTLTYNIEYFNPSKGTYETGTFYKPDPEYSIKSIDGNNITYNPMSISLIEY